MALPRSQKVQSIDICVSSWWPSLKNFRALAGLEVIPSQVWYQHGPDMVPKNEYPIGMGLRPCWLSPENFRALAGLEVRFSHLSASVSQGGSQGGSQGVSHMQAYRSQANFIKCLIFRIMSGPCVDHVWTLFYLPLFTQQLELWNFQDWVTKV